VKPRTVLYIVALLLVVVFALANWTLLAASVELNLLVAKLQAPLGILMLLIVALIVLFDLGVHAMTHRAWTRERRALAKDLESLRVRAEAEDQSRIAALRSAMERELATIHTQLDQLIAGQSSLLGQAPASRVTDSNVSRTIPLND
jgi:uncharacterized integral membrane protein